MSEYETHEPLVPEPTALVSRFVDRELVLCPICKCLVRRVLGDQSNGREHGAWRCDLHGEVTPVREMYEVSAGDDE